MKKRNPSNGQNGELMQIGGYWFTLAHNIYDLILILRSQQ